MGVGLGRVRRMGAVSIRPGISNSEHLCQEPANLVVTSAGFDPSVLCGASCRWGVRAADGRRSRLCTQIPFPLRESRPGDIWDPCAPGAPPEITLLT